MAAPSAHPNFPEPPREGGGEGRFARVPAWLWVVALAVFATVAWMQRPDDTPTAKEREEAALAATGMKVEPPKVSMLVLFGKLIVAFEKEQPGQGQAFMQFVDLVAQAPKVDREGVKDAGGDPTKSVTAPTPTGVPGAEAKARGGKEPALPPSAAARFRAAVLAAEANGPKDALRRLDALKGDVDPHSELVGDIEAAHRVYGAEAEGEPIPTLAQAEVDGLQKRHGFFAGLLASRGNPTDPARVAAESSGMGVMALMVAVGLGIGLAVLVGLGVLGLGVVMLATGRMQRPYLPPTRYGRLWVETFAIFVGGFLVTKGISLAVHRATSSEMAPVAAALGFQACLALVPMWPVVRGMAWRDFATEIGWHRGRGVLTEIGIGVVSYLAMLPIYFGVAAITILMFVLTKAIQGAVNGTGPGDGPEPLPDNKIFDLVAGGNVWLTLGVFVLATVWAPFVEESIFRGALYRKLRSAWVWPAAAVVTAAMFALMHGYPAIGLVMVGTLGVYFAFVREWRHSLIASMTCHFLHNGLILTILVAMLQFAKG